MRNLTGADIICECLIEQGVDTVFGYPGGAILNIYDALYKHADEIRHILTSHEQGASHAADGYARATGKVGVCIATSGPGATNLVTGIATAYMDSIPVVFITGQVGAQFIGKNAFQETDIIGVTRPVVKHSYLVLNVDDIPRIICEAFKLASEGRPGPVVVDIPKNVQQAMAVPVFPEEVKVKSLSAGLRVNPSDIEAIRKAIKKAQRPCIYAGGGIISSGASEELREFAHSYNIPVTTTLMGLGSFPEEDPLSLRWLGMHGTYYANYAANECDLLIALGARFDDRVTGPVATFAQDAYIIHVDIDVSEINKNKRADLGVIADVKEVLAELNKKPLRKDYTEWLNQIAQWKQEHPFSYIKSKPHTPPQPQFVIEKLYELTHGDAIIVPGVGQHQMWAAQFYQYTRPRQLLTSGGLGTMGFGLPAAMGAKLALPEELIINIDGDGSFQMNIQELGTIAVEEIAVKMIILNNQHLGMVAQIEDLFYRGKRGNTDLRTKENKPFPHFVGIANSYDIPARDVFSADELEDAIREMLETPGPFLLDCHTVYQDHVLPMIPGGKSCKDMITE